MENVSKRYDVAVIGGGPAGYTAALYSSRAGRSTVLFEKGSPGGQMGITSVIENYPGFESVDGFTLAVNMQNQAKNAGAVILNETVISVSLTEKTKTVVSSGGEYEADAVIIATGAKPRLLGVTGEKEYTGHGVSYCATCDGMFFRKKQVAVCGGGETALEDALYLSNICEKVTVIHRREGFRATRHTVEKCKGKENIEFVLNATVSEITGDGGRVSGVKITYTDGKSGTLPCSAVFVAIGRVPETELFTGQITADESGYIIAGEDCMTNIGGVFAAGDVRTKSLRQIVTAASDGAMAAKSAEEWINEIKQ